MQQAPVQVTVVEYINEFFKNYSKRAYGKTLLVNANKGAETLMGMLKLVLSRGGRDELRIALHCFKDQLTKAINSAQSLRQQQTEEVFALLSSLIDAAERLRQFSPVKEQLSTAVLEEVRFRLYRIIVGDGFYEDVALRRRALDIAFTAMMREAADHERSRARLNKLPSSGANSGAAAAAALSAASGAIVVAGHHIAAGAGAEAAGKGPGRLRGSFQRKAAALSGPDFSSWEGLWTSLATMAPRRMLPLLQAVMTDLYLGKLMPGSPAAAAAATAAGASSSSSCGAASTPRSVNAQQQQSVQPALQQQQQAAQLVHSGPLQQAPSDDVPNQVPQQQAEPSVLPQPQPQQQQQDAEPLRQCNSQATGSGKAVIVGQDAGVQVGDSTTEQRQQLQQDITSVPASIAAYDAAPDGSMQQQPPPFRLGRSSARPGHPIAAGYGAGTAAAAFTPSTSSENTPTAIATVSSIVSTSSSIAAVAAGGSFNSSSSSPRQGSTPSEARGTFATLASRLSGGGSNKDKSVNAGGGSSSPKGSKWGTMAGGFLGLQSSNGVIGSGRLIPRGWVQFGGTSVQQQKGVNVADSASCSLDAGSVGDAGIPHHQQQQDQVSAAVEPGTPSKGNSATASVAAAAAAVTLVSGDTSGSETGVPPDRGIGTGDDGGHGFEGDEPDWGSGNSGRCNVKAPTGTAVHCTAGPAAAGL